MDHALPSLSRATFIVFFLTVCCCSSCTFFLIPALIPHCKLVLRTSLFASFLSSPSLLTYAFLSSQYFFASAIATVLSTDRQPHDIHGYLELAAAHMPMLKAGLHCVTNMTPCCCSFHSEPAFAIISRRQERGAKHSIDADEELRYDRAH